MPDKQVAINDKKKQVERKQLKRIPHARQAIHERVNGDTDNERDKHAIEYQHIPALSNKYLLNGKKQNSKKQIQWYTDKANDKEVDFVFL